MIEQGYSPRIDRALAIASRAHGGEFRRGSDVPYVMHPVHVAMILVRYGLSEDVVIAGLLHDVLEDSDLYSEEDLRGEFGDEVVGLVLAVTENKGDGETKRPWRVRKNEAIARLRKGTPDEAALKAADAIHNLRSLTQEVAREGLKTMERFSKGPPETLWYYESIAAIVADRLGVEHPMGTELRHALKELTAAFERGD